MGGLFFYVLFSRTRGRYLCAKQRVKLWVHMQKEWLQARVQTGAGGVLNPMYFPMADIRWMLLSREIPDIPSNLNANKT